MSIVRTIHNRENPFVQLNKKALWDQNLSLEAVGLWARLLSRPDNWEVRVSELCKSCGCGRDKIRSILNELITNGYAFRVQPRTKGKFADYDTYVFEFKMTKEEIKEMFTETDFPAPVSSAPINTTLLIQSNNTPILKEIEKDREINKQIVDAPHPKKTLPSSKGNKIKQPKHQLSQEEKELIDQMMSFETPIGNSLDTAFLTVMFKNHGYERVKKAWEFTTSKEIKSSLGGLLRTAIENQWELPDEAFKENKRICEEFASKHPSRVNITQTYLTCPEMGFDIDFRRPTGDVAEQLTKICKILNVNNLCNKTDDYCTEGGF